MSELLLLSDAAPPADLMHGWLEDHDQLVAVMPADCYQSLERELGALSSIPATQLVGSIGSEEMIGRLGDWIRQHDCPSKIVLYLASVPADEPFSATSNSAVQAFTSTQIAAPLRLLHMALGQWSAATLEFVYEEPQALLDQLRHQWLTTLAAELSQRYPDASLTVTVV